MGLLTASPAASINEMLFLHLIINANCFILEHFFLPSDSWFELRWLWTSLVFELVQSWWHQQHWLIYFRALLEMIFWFRDANILRMKVRKETIHSIWRNVIGYWNSFCLLASFTFPQNLIGFGCSWVFGFSSRNIVWVCLACFLLCLKESL